jgi:carbon-monoxide dehydrogenase medium subunit
MTPVRYEAPESLESIMGLIAREPGAMMLAGGTDLLVQYHEGAKRPTVFVDLKRVPELIAIVLDEWGLRLGAAAPAAEICEHEEIGRLWPGLTEAVRLIGSAQIQGRASVGGNLCNASPAADSTCALMVNHAQCVVAHPGGQRTIAVEDFCTAPGQTVLRRGEVLVAIRVPRPSKGTADAYLRLIPRSEMDIAVAGAAVSVTLDAAGVCSAARVAIGAVAPTALLVPEAARALIGSRIDPAALSRAAEAASAAARPIDDTRGSAAYRRSVVAVLTRRAAAKAAERARGR